MSPRAYATTSDRLTAAETQILYHKADADRQFEGFEERMKILEKYKETSDAWQNKLIGISLILMPVGSILSVIVVHVVEKIFFK